MLEADYSIEKMPGGMIQKGRTRRAGVGGGNANPLSIIAQKKRIYTSYLLLPNYLAQHLEPSYITVSGIMQAPCFRVHPNP